MSTSLKHDKMLYVNNRIYLHFEKYIIIYFYNRNTSAFSLEYAKNYFNDSTNGLLTTTIDMDTTLSGLTVFYSSHNMIYQYSISNGSESHYDFLADMNLPASTNISSVQVALSRFLIICTTSKMYQYDFQIGRVVSSVQLL